MKFGLKGFVKDLDKKQNRVSGYASTFSVIDDGADIVERGAFRRTINSWGPEGRNRIKALYQHDPTWLVGRPISLIEDEAGLLHETQFSDTAIARDTFTLIDDGVLTEQSIGYDVIQADNDEQGLRHLRELKLYEYSFVTWGMNQFTPITGVKGLTMATELATRMANFEKALRDGRFESDEVPHLIQIGLSQWKEALENSKLSLKDEIDQLDLDDPDALEKFLDEQVKSLTAIDLKEGRVLSSRNRSLVQEAVEALSALLDLSDSEKSTRSKQDPPPPEQDDSVSDLLKSLRGQTNEIKMRGLSLRLQEFSRELKEGTLR